jgi:polyhydroxyalkanoate synthesis repressor PhaR
MSEPETIHISRYSSRRLYNTNTSDYVTLDDIARLIREGHNIKIIDKKTGDDLTRQILLQIITEHEARGENLLPLNILTDIVRSYSDQAKNFIPEFLSQSFDAIKEQQQELIGSFQKQVSDTLDPQKAFQNMEKWQQTQAEMLGSMMKSWMPDSSTSSDVPSGNEPPSESGKTAPDAVTETDQTKRDDDVEQMKRQIAELQEKLKDL